MAKLFTDPSTRSKPDLYFRGVQGSDSRSGNERGMGAVGRPLAFPASVNLGGVTIAPATILAPMAGVTDTVFRRFIKYSSFDPQWSAASGCGLIMTEFTSADGILRCRQSKRKRYLHFYDEEHPISAQLFGSDPEVLADAAKLVEDLGFDLVDLNLGCPAKRVVKCNGGSGLLRDLPRIREIFSKMRAAVTIPFTVKFRAGWSEKEIVCVELARIAEDCGLNAVALHARTREQGYSGNARWEWIAAIKDAVKIPLIGNGDIRVPEDAVAMVAATRCDAVMVGRTAASNPWIFRQLAQYLATGHYHQPTEADRYEMMQTYFRMLIAEEIPGAVGKMKQFAAWFTHGIANGATLRRSVFEASSESEVLNRVEQFFSPIFDRALESDRALAAMASRAGSELRAIPVTSAPQISSVSRRPLIRAIH